MFLGFLLDNSSGIGSIKEKKKNREKKNSPPEWSHHKEKEENVENEDQKS